MGEARDPGVARRASRAHVLAEEPKGAVIGGIHGHVEIVAPALIRFAPRAGHDLGFRGAHDAGRIALKPPHVAKAGVHGRGLSGDGEGERGVAHAVDGARAHPAVDDPARIGRGVGALHVKLPRVARPARAPELEPADRPMHRALRHVGEQIGHEVAEDGFMRAEVAVNELVHDRLPQRVEALAARLRESVEGGQPVHARVELGDRDAHHRAQVRAGIGRLRPIHGELPQLQKVLGGVIAAGGMRLVVEMAHEDPGCARRRRLVAEQMHRGQEVEAEAGALGQEQAHEAGRVAGEHLLPLRGHTPAGSGWCFRWRRRSRHPTTPRTSGSRGRWA